MNSIFRFLKLYENTIKLGASFQWMKMKRILVRRLSAAANVNSDREILGVTKNATIQG